MIDLLLIHLRYVYHKGVQAAGGTSEDKRTATNPAVGVGGESQTVRRGRIGEHAAAVGSPRLRVLTRRRVSASVPPKTCSAGVPSGVKVVVPSGVKVVVPSGVKVVVRGGQVAGPTNLFVGRQPDRTGPDRT